MNKQIEEMAKDIHEELETENIPYYECDFMAQRLISKGWIKPLKDSVVQPTVQSYSTHDNDLIMLSKEEFEKLKRVEEEKDRLYEIKLDLENQLIEKGWTEYEGADEIEKRVSKETAEKFAKEMLSWLEKDDIDGRNCVIEVAKQFGIEVKE